MSQWCTGIYHVLSLALCMVGNQMFSGVIRKFSKGRRLPTQTRDQCQTYNYNKMAPKHRKTLAHTTSPLQRDQKVIQ